MITPALSHYVKHPPPFSKVGDSLGSHSKLRLLSQCCIQNFKSGARWAHGSRKIGPTLQNVGSMIFVNYLFIKSTINQTLNIGELRRR